MAKKKKGMKELLKMAKELNDLELTEDPIDVDEDDEDALKEEFISAIEEIDDDGKVDDVDEDIIDFYEALIDTGGKGKDKKEKETTEEFDADECREEVEDFDVKEMKAYIEENELDIDTKVKKSTLEEVVDEVVEAMEEKAEDAAKAKKKKDKKKGKGKKDKKEKKGKKDKKGKKGKGKKGKKDKDDDDDDDVDLPKGLRKGTLPAKVYAAIGEDGATLEKIAKVVAKAKGKKVDKVINLSFRTIIRKVSAIVPIVGKFTGDEESAFFTIEEEEED